jgi:hypothetical protein
MHCGPSLWNIDICHSERFNVNGFKTFHHNKAIMKQRMAEKRGDK